MFDNYYKISQASNFGVIASAPTAAGLSVVAAKKVTTAIVPTLHSISLWDLKTSKKTNSFTFLDPSLNGPVTCLFDETAGNGPRTIFVGFQTGQICTAAIKPDPKNRTQITLSLEHTFEAHRKAVTAFDCMQSRSILISGSKDTDLLVWDLTEGRLLRRLRAHTNEITNIKNNENLVFSSSKDGLIKIWDIDTFICLKTISGHNGEIWSMAFDKTSNCLITGSVDDKLRSWSFGTKRKNGENLKIEYNGFIETLAKKRICSMLNFGSLLFVVSTNRKIEVFYRRSRKEIDKKVNKRLKRTRSEVRKIFI
ncbi:beta transducin [Bonamia ostreae]|uniref:Beta transducin n=1 Tax=Bonamia ostreae TaxID=126728 RepID=A0ABV2AQX8_9EUKA